MQAKICVIIPCHNEEHRFPAEKFVNFYNLHPNVYFCLVDDGSSDGTAELLNRIVAAGEERTIFVNLEKNHGKAEAVRRGFWELLEWRNFDYIAYLDADFSTPPEEILHLFKELKKDRACKMALGSRVLRLGANIKRSAVRHYFGRIFATLASLMLDLPVYDTQCGAKLMDTELAMEVFKEPFISPWLFDIEIFARIIETHGYGYVERSLMEVPLNQWVDYGGSKIKLSYLFKLPFELMKIFVTYKKRRKNFCNV